MAESSGISSAATGFDLRKISSAILRGDVALAVGIVAILMMLILPISLRPEPK